MALLFVQFFALGGVIVLAGLYLAKFADVIADLTGMGRTLAGLILLAAATSLPELAVDCSLVLLPKPGTNTAVGALLGSSLFNLLILGVLEFCHSHKHKIFSPASDEHVLSTATSILATGVAVVFVLMGVSGITLKVFNVGLGTIAIFVIYVLSLRLIFLDQKARHELDEEPRTPPRMTLSAAMLGYAVCTLVIFLAANSLAPTAEAIADRTGLGGTFVGSTFVALTTSLPELVTTAAAVRMGAFEMAMGNVIGSNNFNMAILFPVDIVYRDNALLSSVAITHAITGGIVILITSIVMMSLVFKAKKRFWIIEPDASLVVGLAVFAIFVLYHLRHWVPFSELVP